MKEGIESLQGLIIPQGLMKTHKASDGFTRYCKAFVPKGAKVYDPFLQSQKFSNSKAFSGLIRPFRVLSRSGKETIRFFGP